jgi:hypothetical protein
VTQGHISNIGIGLGIVGLGIATYLLLSIPDRESFDEVATWPRSVNAAGLHVEF